LVLAVTSVGGPAVAMKVSQDNLRAAEAAVKKAQRDSELAWCGVITVVDDAARNPESPPTTPFGRDLAAGIAAVRAKYQCPPSGPK
jgi:hypothetical protein